MGLTKITSNQSDLLVSWHETEEPPFTRHDFMDDDLVLNVIRDLVTNENMIFLVDESAGGVVGCIHSKHVDRIIGLLNLAGYVITRKLHLHEA